jgi:FkbM family methyltransferase
MRLSPDDFIEREIYRGIFEVGEMALISWLVREGEMAVDIGANVGRHTLELADAVGPSGRVVAVEPSAGVFESLVAATSALDQVEVLRLAIDPVLTVATLAQPPGANRGGLNLMGRGSMVEEVPCVGLDELLENQDIARVDFLKVDVEGWEERVFESASRYLSEGRIGYILAEVSPNFGDTGYVDELIAGGFSAWEVRWSGVGLFRLRGQPTLSPVASSSQIQRQANVLFEHTDVDASRRQAMIEAR